MSYPFYNEAVAAGLFPAQAEAAPEPEAGIAPELAGGFAGEGLRPPDMELQSPPPEEPTGLIGQSRQGFALSQSQKGFDDVAMGKVSKWDAPLYQQYKLGDAQAQQGAERDAGVMGAAADTEVSAVQSLTEAAVEKKTAEGVQAAFLQGISDDFAADEQKANVAAAGMAAQSKADYVAALADFRASRVDPGQLWGNMNGGQRFGMLVSAFAHDFLGAKGIRTSAMDTLNKAIDRNIDAQINNIKTKGQAAEGFKDLWYMQRSQAASDVEARTRVRGFLLEGAKQHVIANMAQYEAGLATAQGQAAIAAIDKELAQNLVKINQHADANALQLRQQALTLHGQKLQAAASAAATKVQRDQLNMQRDSAAAKAKAEYMDSLLADTTASGGGKLRWQIIHGEKATQDGIRDKMGALMQFGDKASRLQELAREVGPLKQGWTKRAMTEKQRQLVQLAEDMAYTMAYADSGKQLTAKEIEQKLAQINIDKLMQRGGTEKQIAQTVEGQYKSAFSKIAPFVRELKEGDPGFGVTMSPSLAPNAGVPSGAPGQAELAEAHKTARSGSRDEGPTEIAIQALSRPDKFNDAHPDTIAKLKVGEEAQNDWETFRHRNPQAAQRTVERQGNAFTEGEGTRTSVEDVKTIPAAGVAVVALRKQAQTGDQVAKKQLIDLADLTNSKPPGSPNDIMLMNFARLELMELTNASKK
jgi:hypothetical protein